MGSGDRLTGPARPRGRRQRLWLGGSVGVAGAVLLAALGAMGAADRVEPPAAAAVAVNGAGAAIEPDLPSTALGADVAAALDREAEQVAALQARFDAANDEETALALQREIEGIKAEVEIEILRIQARHARAAGRLEAAERIEAAAAALGAPRPAAEPSPRPAPRRGVGTGDPE